MKRDDARRMIQSVTSSSLSSSESKIQPSFTLPLPVSVERAARMKGSPWRSQLRLHSFFRFYRKASVTHRTHHELKAPWVWGLNTSSFTLNVLPTQVCISIRTIKPTKQLHDVSQDVHLIAKWANVKRFTLPGGEAAAGTFQHALVFLSI